MSAKEMFEELGYKQISNNVNYIIYNFEEIFELRFYLPQQEIEIIEKPPFNTIDLGEIKAINKQIEELGWK